MDYLTIYRALRDGNQIMAARAFEDAVNAEGIEQGKIHNGDGWPLDAGLRAAERLYARDVTEMLEHDNLPIQVSPEDLLFHRRYAVAWAVASILKREGLHRKAATP